MTAQKPEEWDIWYPKAGATGIPFARGRAGQRAEVMLVHAAPEGLTVTVRAADGGIVAAGTELRATDDTPIARLSRRDDRIEREDIWPGERDIGIQREPAGRDAHVHRPAHSHPRPLAASRPPGQYHPARLLRGRGL